MSCEIVSLPGGSRAIACGRSSKPKRCWPCVKEGRFTDAGLLCDGPPAPASTKKTCDVPICCAHALRVAPDRDLCPSCQARRPEVAHAAKPEQSSLFGGAL